MAGPLAWAASKVGGLGNGGNESKMTGESQLCSPPEARAAKFKVISRLMFINQVLFFSSNKSSAIIYSLAVVGNIRYQLLAEF
ncbi:hypothetical protein SLA2020_232170 [Shorea laevis]